MRNFARNLSLALLLVSSPSYAEKAYQRDWQQYPAVVQVKTNETVYAIGDAHADLQRLTGVLLAAKLIASAPSSPEKVEWSAGKSVLVVTGDMIDKWTDSMQVIALLRALQSSAAKQGGQVILTMGNHEAEFLAEPGGKKTAEFAKQLEQAGLKPQDVGACKGDLGQFLCQLPIAVAVNDWFFSHGGNSNGKSIAELEEKIQKGYKKDGFATKTLVGNNSILEARLNSKGPNDLPWFYEGDKDKKDKDVQVVLKKYAKNLGVKHLVQGHQAGKVNFPGKPNRAEGDFFQRYGLLFLIDSGMSRGIEGSTSTGGALRITGNEKADIICANGTVSVLWSKQENQASAAQHCGEKP